MQRLLSCVCGALLWATLQSPSFAADPPCYAILSLIGDKLDIAINQPQTGSRLEQTRHADLPLTGPGLDNTAVTSAARAVAVAVPGAVLVQLASSSTELYDKQREIFEGSDGKVSLPSAIIAAMKKDKATQLILISKFRDEARIGMRGGFIGNGTLEGMGFYVDRVTETRNLTTGDAGFGFLAPFMYVKVSLIDAQTLKVTGSKTIRASMAMSAGEAKLTGHPWDVLDSQGKVRIMSRLIQDEMATVVPELLKAAPAS